MANIERKLIYKVYQEDDTYIGVLDDVISDLSIEKTINGGDSEFTITLARKIDDFEEDTIVKFNNRIKVYLQDTYNLDGDKLVAYGYIVSYKPYLHGKDEHVEVVCLSAVSKLKNDFYRTGTASIAAELGVELTSKRTDEMMEAIIDHYRSVETNSMLSNDYSNSDSTPDNSGGAISFTHRFFNMKHLDALREASKFLPRNKSGGYFFYWRISTDGKLYVKNISTTADHTLMIGKHITEISGHKTIEGIVNRVYFWNEKGTADPDYIKLTSEDATSQSNYDTIASYIADSKITTSPAASLVSASRVYDKKDPKVKIKLELNSEYDLASLTPGQTCQILNAENNPFNIGGDGVLLIHTVRYNVDTVTLEVSDAQERFEDVVEEERMRLDLEMTWFGKITQALTAAQLSPANRVWTTTITFSATTGADAYRQIDWTAGIIYIPAGASGSAATRVIHIGNTGLMSPGSIYYIYLDEGTLPTASAVVTRTGTSKQGGDILADDGSPGWSNDQYKGYVVEIGGQKKLIKSNTASILTLEDRWTVADQSSQTFTISKLTLSTTTSEETAMSDNRIVFTNAAANASADSEAILVPNAGIDLIVDGSTQIAKHSISATEIIANTITTTEINFTPYVIGTDSLDDIGDGATYGKVLQTNMTAGQILLSACSGSLDDLSNGTYAKVLTTDITAGHVQLVSCGGDADDISEGASNYYAGASGADFRKAIDTLDNITNGGSYGKVLLTNISAGSILLAQCSGNLDNISNGSSYGKVALTAISAGKIVLTSAGVTGTLSTSYTSAKCTDANADQTSTHTAAAISGQGALATQNNLDGVPNGSSYAKVYSTDIYAGHINLIERTVSTKNISINAGVPHVKVAYNNSDVIQLAVSGSEPRLEVYYGGAIRQRMNKNGLYFYSTSGALRGYIVGMGAGGLSTNTNGGHFYFSDDVYLGSNHEIWWLTKYLKSDGTHLVTNQHFAPSSAASQYKLGTSTNYWGEINYKSLADRGCLGCFDNGVELQDGSIVSDCEALQAIKKHPTEKTIYGVDKLDYSSFPKVSYLPVDIATEDMYETISEQFEDIMTYIDGMGKKKTDKFLNTRKKKILKYKKGEKIGEDGVEMTSMFSIMIGAFKEIDNRLKELEK